MYTKFMNKIEEAIAENLARNEKIIVSYDRNSAKFYCDTENANHDVIFIEIVNCNESELISDDMTDDEKIKTILDEYGVDYLEYIYDTKRKEFNI